MAEFDIQVECPACGATFGVPRIRQGRTENCPVCRSPVRVPGTAAAGEEGTREQVGRRKEAPVAAPTAEQVAGTAALGAPEAPAAAPSGKCLVCLEDDARFDISKVSPIVDELDGQFTLDTRLQLAQGMGILAEHIPKDLAEEMAARLRGAQVPAFAVDEAFVPAVERQLPILRIHSVADEALYVQSDVHGTVQSIPWPLVAGGFCTKQHMVRGGPTELRSETHLYFTGGLRPPVEHTVHTAVRRPREPDIECTLLLRGKSGNLYSMRFTERKIRYSYQGARRSPSSGRGFPLFLTDIIRRCPDGFFPGSTRAVAAGRRIRVAKLKRKDDYHRYLQWACACVAAGLH